MTAVTNQYRILSILQSSGEATTSTLAKRLNLSHRTVTTYLQHLELEGLITVKHSPVTGSVSSLTETGQAYSVPETQRVENLMDCGHPRTALPFCMQCRNAERRRFCRDNKTVLPVLRSQMRRTA